MSNWPSFLRCLPKAQIQMLAQQELLRRMRNRPIGPVLIRDDPSKPSLVLDPNHPLGCLLHERARNKILYGGRNSAKSWGVAEALVRKSNEEKIRVLCTREYQNSIRDSSHRILQDTIWRLGLDQRFHVTKDSIRTAAGSEFIFKGLHNSVQSIKSTEGIDICWVEEAQTVSAASWRTLAPTIRKPASEIWVTYNLINAEDATHARFVVPGTGLYDYSPIAARPNTIVRKVSYRDNPYFDEGQREEMEADKAANYNMWLHVWEGQPLKIDNSIIFSGKTVVQEFDSELWRSSPRLFFGADFGFAEDPSTLIRSFELNNMLYVSDEAYGHHVEMDEFDEFYGSVPDARDWPIKGDSSRPETISHIRNKFGYNIEAAEKWPGCVEDGIAFLLKYDQIVIHPRAHHTVREAQLYRYKVDRVTEEILPIVVDKDNHCFDAIRYSLDGYIQQSGDAALWARLGHG